MTKVEVDLLTDQGNGAVLRLPERKFPGVLEKLGRSLKTHNGTIAFCKVGH